MVHFQNLQDKRLSGLSIKLMTVFSGKKTTTMEILGDGVVKAKGIHLVGRGPRFARLDLTVKFYYQREKEKMNPIGALTGNIFSLLSSTMLKEEICLKKISKCIVHLSFANLRTVRP